MLFIACTEIVKLKKGVFLVLLNCVLQCMKYISHAYWIPYVRIFFLIFY